MVGTVQELEGIISKDRLADEVHDMHRRWNQAKNSDKEIIREVHNYVFATDTSSTTNAKLPWKNKTTRPKLCQIRDNLHAQYLATLSLENIDWEAFSSDPEDLEKREIIKSYMSNKLRNSDFRNVISQLLYDWIDTGNAFVTTDYINDWYEDEETGEKVTVYSGPVARRISYHDIEFNPLSVSWAKTPKIVRVLTTIGDLYQMVAEQPEMGYLKDAIDKAVEQRAQLSQYDDVDVEKTVNLKIEGFGSYHEYVNSEYVELLHFYGDLYEKVEDKYHRKRAITVMDGAWVIRDVPIPNWLGRDNVFHSAWRRRPGNLYGMGPLANLIGLQYRMDHLENIKADAMDMAVIPTLKIRGNVEEFNIGPLEEIYLGDDGDVMPLQLDLGAVIQADSQAEIIEAKMEQYAGSPRETMGLRSPGEKTKFEVQTLAQGASRIFQEKITQFEVEIVEPLLNAMLEQARRNLDGVDVIRVLDEELGIEEFITITKDDLKAKGKIRAVGARHFAQQAQMVQNYMGFRNMFASDPAVMSHISGVKEAELFERLLGLEKEQLVEKNIRVHEQGETQRMANQVSQSVEQINASPVEGLPQGIQ